MNPGLIAQAAGTFAVTNIDDIVLLAVYFGRAGTDPRAVARVVIGQYLGFATILVASLLGALGAGRLPDAVLPYLGLLPLLLGIREAWVAWRERRAHDADDGAGGDGSPDDGGSGPRMLEVAGVTLANGGDNIGVYVPVLAVVDTAGQLVHLVVFLVLVAVWCAAGRFLATRAPVARALARSGHIVLPVVLIAIGLTILVEGGAFGL